MNLMKMGLLKDSKGKISRPSTEPASLRTVSGSPPSPPGSPSTYGDASPPPPYTSPLVARSRKIELSKKLEETPEKYRERVKKELEILDLDQDINTMDLRTLRRHFGYRNDKIKVGMFARNIIWQVARMTDKGNAPFFVAKGGNVRSLWYYVKTIVESHQRSFGTEKMEGTFSSELSTMSAKGLISYVDLNFIDVNRADRWVAPAYGTTNVVLMAEKRAFSDEFLSLGKHYGVTVQATGGQPSRVTVENLLLDMHNAGHDLTKPFTVFALVDCDPAGWNIASSFVEAMLELGLSKVNSFWPFGRQRPRQPWIDIVSVKDLDPAQVEQFRHPLSIGRRERVIANEWIQATGGLYGKDGLTWALSSELFLGYISEHLKRKLPRYLKTEPEAFQKRVAMEKLAPSLAHLVSIKLQEENISARPRTPR